MRTCAVLLLLITLAGCAQRPEKEVHVTNNCPGGNGGTGAPGAPGGPGGSGDGTAAAPGGPGGDGAPGGGGNGGGTQCNPTINARTPAAAASGLAGPSL